MGEVLIRPVSVRWETSTVAFIDQEEPDDERSVIQAELAKL